MPIVSLSTDANAEKNWKSILESWSTVMDRYEQNGTCFDGAGQPHREVAYWNTERANVCMLAAAVYLSNGIAITEFEHQTIGKAHAYPDIWLRMRDSTAFIGEAKLSYVRDPVLVAGDVARLLGEARAEVLQLEREPRVKRCAIAILVPVRKSSMRSWAESFDQAVKSTKPIAAALYRSLGQGVNVPKHEGKPHPGCMIFVQEA